MDVHCCTHNREYISGNTGKPGHEHLEVEAHGIKGAGDIRRYAQTEHDGQEFPKVANGAQHSF